MSDEEWMTPEQATEKIKAAIGRHQLITLNKVRFWLRTGKLMGTVVDGQWRVYRRDLQDFFKSAREERAWRRKFYRGGRFAGR